MTKSSRDKLNSTHLVGSIGVGALVAAFAGSWPLFLLVSGGLILTGLMTNEIRLRGRK